SCPSPVRGTVRCWCGNQRGADTSYRRPSPTASVGSVSGLRSRPPSCRGGPSPGAPVSRPCPHAAPGGDHGRGVPVLCGGDAAWLWLAFSRIVSWETCGPPGFCRASGAVAVCLSTRATGPLASVRTASPLRHVLTGLPAVFCYLYAVYMCPNGCSHSHAIFCTPHR